MNIYVALVAVIVVSIFGIFLGRIIANSYSRGYQKGVEEVSITVKEAYDRGCKEGFKEATVETLGLGEFRRRKTDELYGQGFNGGMEFTNEEIQDMRRKNV